MENPPFSHLRDIYCISLLAVKSLYPKLEGEEIPGTSPRMTRKRIRHQKRLPMLSGIILLTSIKSSEIVSFVLIPQRLFPIFVLSSNLVVESAVNEIRSSKSSILEAALFTKNTVFRKEHSAPHYLEYYT